MVGYIFDATKGETPRTLAEKRAIAKALLGAQRAPQNVGEGISALGDGIVARVLNERADAAEQSGMASAQDAFGPILAALGGGGGFPSAPSSPSLSAAPATPREPAISTMDPLQTEAATGVVPGNDLPSGIRATAQSLGIDPLDLATAISYETGGTFDPMQKGPTTQWGQHKGLIQFGEPQAKQYGVNWDDPLGSQLGPDGAVAKYLRDTGVKPGMGLLDIYSAINAGGVGRYNRSDANNGGAPGSVRDKVEQQMGGHRQKALALLGDGGQAPAAQALDRMADPVQVASLDPYAGAMAAGAEQGIPADNAGLQALAKLKAGGGQQIAQALTGSQTDAMPEMAGNAPVGQGGLSIPQLLAAGSNPFMPEGNQKIIDLLMQEEMKKRDPAYGMGLDKQRLELEALRNPRMSPYEQEQTRLKQAELDAQQKKLMELTGGNTVFDPVTRQPVFTAPKEASLPAGVQEYEYARQQGFPGTYQDWESSKRGGMSLQTNPDGTVSFQQGNNIKPLTEGQSKDAVYATRAEGALPLIDKFGDALTSLPETMGGQLPVVGNYAKSPEFQQAEQAGLEFLQAILRKDTGAAIAKEETEQYGTVYLPRPGDSPELLEQKKASRARALEAIRAGMPPQALLYVEQALAKERGAAKKQPTVIDGYKIEEVD